MTTNNTVTDLDRRIFSLLNTPEKSEVYSVECERSKWNAEVESKKLAKKSKHKKAAKNPNVLTGKIND